MRERDAAGTFTVRVGDEDWRRTRNLGRAGPEDSVFAVDRRTGAVIFGDGTHGRRPPADAVVTIAYRGGGGGAAGNAQVSVATRWPPAEATYLVAVCPDGVRIGRTAVTRAHPPPAAPTTRARDRSPAEATARGRSATPGRKPRRR